MFFALKNSSSGCCSSLQVRFVSLESSPTLLQTSSPIDIAELVLSHAPLEGDRDIECSTSRNGTADTRHGDEGDVLNLYVSGWFGDKDQALVQKV